MAFLLAAGAGLLSRSFIGLLRWEPGFERGHLLTFFTYASMSKYRAPEVSALFARVEDELRSLPGVASVGRVSNGPLFGGEETGEFVLEGGRSADPFPARWFDMSPAYVPTLGLALRRGRLLAGTDRLGAPPVALVNEEFVRRYLAGVEPLGARVRRRGSGESIEIVGVVADVPPFFPGARVQPEISWPAAQSPRWGTMFVLRTSGPPRDLLRAVEARLSAVDPDLGTGQVATMEERVEASLARPRFAMTLIGTFAALALVLAAVGIYGVLSATVARRRQELGVRLALGATGSQVLGLVLRRGLLLAGLGAAAGLALALAFGRVVASLLHGVRPWDPVTFFAVSAVVLAASLAACLVPALRAARLDPIETLRAE